MLDKDKTPCVVITRPQRQAKVWADKLHNIGIDSIGIPLLDIVSFQEDNFEHEQLIRSVKNCILDLDNYHKIIFVSQNAVECAMPWIENYWPQIPIGISFFAIGETTAKLLATYGMSVINLAGSHNGDMTSETLLLHPDLQSVADEKILIVRGVGGRGHLADILWQRGAQVEYCEVYQRGISADAQSQLNDWLTDNQGWEMHNYLLAFHSAETWNYFCEVLQKIKSINTTELMLKLNTLPIVVPSVRVKEQVNGSGFHNIILAKNATDESMTQAINLYFRSEPA